MNNEIVFTSNDCGSRKSRLPKHGLIVLGPLSGRQNFASNQIISPKYQNEAKLMDFNDYSQNVNGQTHKYRCKRSLSLCR